MQTINREQFPTLEEMKEMQFWTFLIKKSRNGKMGLWFVMVHMPYFGNIFMTRDPVWRKIEKNGLPRDLGYHGQTPLEGEIRLLGLENAGPNEILYISKTRELGFPSSIVPYWVPPHNQEHYFSFLLRIKNDPL